MLLASADTDDADHRCAQLLRERRATSWSLRRWSPRSPGRSSGTLGPQAEAAFLRLITSLEHNLVRAQQKAVGMLGWCSRKKEAVCSGGRRTEPRRLHSTSIGAPSAHVARLHLGSDGFEGDGQGVIPFQAVGERACFLDRRPTTRWHESRGFRRRPRVARQRNGPPQSSLVLYFGTRTSLAPSSCCPRRCRGRRGAERGVPSRRPR